MEIDKLKLYVSQRLTNLTSIGVYDGKAPKDASFPYLIFKFESSSYSVRHRNDWMLEFDFWDDKTDDSVILAEAEKVKKGNSPYIGFEGSTQSEAEGFYQSWIEFAGEIIDPEPNISHYNQRYLLKVD